MSNFVDFRSDTVTQPTPQMRQAMAMAPVGDDVFGEDPTLLELENEGAKVLGKEAALFLPSGTMANQVAVNLWARPGDEVLLHEGCHVYRFETGALAMLSGVQARTLAGPGGMVPLDAFDAEVRPAFDAYPRTSLVVLENTNNWEGGAVLTETYVNEVGVWAHRRGLKVHLDGARLMNAAVARGVSCSSFTEHVDTVTLCLSKGLGAPVGTLLAASRESIAAARRVRKRLGGGMRQAGILGAAGLIALRDGPRALPDDHRRAERLFQIIAATPGIRSMKPATNMVVVTLQSQQVDVVVNLLRERGILVLGFGPGRLRFVTHRDLSDADIERAGAALNEVLRLS